MRKFLIRKIKRIVKWLLFLTGVNFVFARFIRLPIILGFHRIKPSIDGVVDIRAGVVYPDVFGRVLDYLFFLGYEFVTLDDVVNDLKKHRLKRRATITFDDGYSDLYAYAYPHLKKRRLPFTLFLVSSTLDSQRLLWQHRLYFAIERLFNSNKQHVVDKYFNQTESKTSPSEAARLIIQHYDKTDLLERIGRMACAAGLNGEDERSIAEQLYLRKENIQEMVQYGLRVEGHGHEHWYLPNLGFEESREELEKCVRVVGEISGKSVKYYSTPFGVGNKWTEGIATAMGIAGICGGTEGLVRRSSDVCRLPRVWPQNDIVEFSFYLTRLYLREIGL
jgi:peptidoglycan/xylan/chitin deacetylase (PgdA/CDA1 family)